MKKSLFALAALGAFAGAAQAQSSVTLYGNLDAPVAYDTANGLSNTYMGSSMNTTSLWGLTGSDDMGSGLKIGFDLKSEINLTNGQTGNASNSPAVSATAAPASTSTVPQSDLQGQTSQLFNRGANLFVTSKDFGEAKIGRQDDIMWQMNGTFSTSDSNSFGSNTMNAAMNNVSAIGALNGGYQCAANYQTTPASTGTCAIYTLGTGVNANDVSGTSTAFVTGARYTSPVIAGFKLSLFSSLGNKSNASATGFNGYAARGAGLEYTYGPVRLGTAITQRDDGAGFNAVQGALFGAQYTMDKLRFTANYQTWSYNSGATSATSGINGIGSGGAPAYTSTLSQSGLNGWSLGVNYKTSANTDVSLAYTSMQDNVTSANSATMWGLTGRYNFSKRTQAYAGAGIVNNSGSAMFSPFYGGQTYSIASYGGQTVTGYLIGLKHSF